MRDMKIVLKQTNYKHDGYDKSIVGSITKKDKGHYVELMTKKDIARKVAEKNNVSVREIQRKYSHLIDQKFDQIVDKYITAWISNKVYKSLSHNPLSGYEKPKSMLVCRVEVKEGNSIFVDEDNIVLFKDFEKVLHQAKRRIKYNGSQKVFLGNAKVKDYGLVSNKEMLKVHRLVQKKIESLTDLVVEYHTLDGKITYYNLHIRSYPSRMYSADYFIIIKGNLRKQ